MDWFHHQNGQLFCEDVNLDDLAAKVGTPAYVYSKRTLLHHYDALAAAFAPVDPLICYSIKSCGNIHIIKTLASRGSGMDVVSGGELHRALVAGVDPARIVYAGVGKTDAEIRQALSAGIGWFNIESQAEFANIASIAKEMGKVANAALRVNPDVADPKTHAKTTTGKKESKFGVDLEQARQFFATFGHDRHLRLNAVHLHIGSPIYSAGPYVQAITKALDLIADLEKQGHRIATLDIGGGFAADYESGKSPASAAYAKEILPLLAEFKDRGGRVILEPGRYIAANAGVLLCRVQYLKTGGRKKFVIVDTGMHHLIRAAMYDAFHFIWPTRVAPGLEPMKRAAEMDLPRLEPTDVVGPICESSDVFCKDRPLPAVKRGDLLCIYTAGAYGMVMASNYNAMPRPVEVLVDGTEATIIRRRETYDDLVAGELEPTAV